MSRRPRHFEPGSLVEVGCRTVQGRYLLRPSQRLNEIVLGALGRAQRQHGMDIHAFTFPSNHYHLLVSPESPHQLADFARDFHSKLAREVNHLHGWEGGVWGERYSLILVSDEEEAQIARFAYLLAHGVKEGLVARVQDWPGVHAAKALLGQDPLLGTWVNRTGLCLAARKAGEVREADFEEPEQVVLTPLPCWAHLSPEAYREKVADLAQGIEEEAARRLRAEGKRPLGARAVLRMNPHHRPVRLKKSRAPLVHAATKAVRQAFYEAYRLFIEAYRAASTRLRAGDLGVCFPPACFPPALPYVPHQAPG